VTVFNPTPGGGTSNAQTFTINADLIFRDGFESGDLSVWSSAITDSGDLSVTPSGALIGEYGMSCVIDDNNVIYLTDESPNAEPRYRARFYFDPNSIVMGGGNAHYIFRGYSGAAKIVLRIEFSWSGTAYRIRASILNDSGVWITTPYSVISDATNFIEFDWKAATSIGASDGNFTLWINGVQQANITGVDNDKWRINTIHLGAVAGIEKKTRGTYYFDAFESRRSSYIGP
jgi:hypothetical protein